MLWRNKSNLVITSQGFTRSEALTNKKRPIKCEKHLIGRFVFRLVAIETVFDIDLIWEFVGFEKNKLKIFQKYKC